MVMGYGHRNMYYLTGQPGWMRLGYSPGWAGRSRSGLGPCAEYVLSGRWPAGAATFTPTAAQSGISDDLELLKAQAERIEQTLVQMRERMGKLEKEGE